MRMERFERWSRLPSNGQFTFSGSWTTISATLCAAIPGVPHCSHVLDCPNAFEFAVRESARLALQLGVCGYRRLPSPFAKTRAAKQACQAENGGVCQSRMPRDPRDTDLSPYKPAVSTRAGGYTEFRISGSLCLSEQQCGNLSLHSF